MHAENALIAELKKLKAISEEDISESHSLFSKLSTIKKGLENLGIKDLDASKAGLLYRTKLYQAAFNDFQKKALVVEQIKRVTLETQTKANEARKNYQTHLSAQLKRDKPVLDEFSDAFLQNDASRKIEAARALESVSNNGLLTIEKDLETIGADAPEAAKQYLATARLRVKKFKEGKIEDKELASFEVATKQFDNLASALTELSGSVQACSTSGALLEDEGGLAKEIDHLKRYLENDQRPHSLKDDEDSKQKMAELQIKLNQIRECRTAAIDIETAIKELKPTTDVTEVAELAAKYKSLNEKAAKTRAGAAK